MHPITISEIEKFFKLVLKKLKEDKVDEVKVELDLYLIILASEWGVSNSPEPAVGSFHDDIAELRKATKEKFFTYNDLDRLATLLRVISETQAPSS